MTVARPLSAGRIVISVSSFRKYRACLCFFERLSSGGDAFWSNRLVLALMLSASSIGRFFNTVSTLATMSFVGIFFGVAEKFRPFSRRSFSWGDNVLVDCPFGFADTRRYETAGHCWKYNHDFDWENKKILDYEANTTRRKTKETIHSLSNNNHINGISYRLPRIWFPALKLKGGSEVNT